MKKYNLEEITVTKVEGVVYENSDNTGILDPTVKPFKDITVKPVVSQGLIDDRYTNNEGLVEPVYTENELEYLVEISSILQAKKYTVVDTISYDPFGMEIYPNTDGNIEDLNIEMSYDYTDDINNPSNLFYHAGEFISFMNSFTDNPIFIDYNTIYIQPGYYPETNETLNGAYSAGQNLIWLNEAVSNYSSTLCHEITHAYVYKSLGDVFFNGLTPHNDKYDAMDEAFSMYFPCAYRDNSLYRHRSTSTRNLAHLNYVYTYGEESDLTEDSYSHYFNRMPIASAWWELREDYDNFDYNQADSFDELLIIILGNDVLVENNPDRYKPRYFFNLLMDKVATDKENWTLNADQEKIIDAYAKRGLHFYPKVISTNQDEVEKNIFGVNDEVYVSISNLPQNTPITIHIVEHQAYTDNMNIPEGVIASIEINSVSIGNDGKWSGPIWSSGLTEGDYDIIVDIGNSQSPGYGKLNFAFADANNTIDGIDGLTEPGFRIDFGIDVVIAVDVTGSMQGQASNLSRTAKTIVGSFLDNDRINAFGFNRWPSNDIQPQGLLYIGGAEELVTVNDNHSSLMGMIPSSGSIIQDNYTCLLTPLWFSQQRFDHIDNPRNKGLIFLSDGKHNWEKANIPGFYRPSWVPSADVMVQNMVNNGIRIFTIRYGPSNAIAQKNMEDMAVLGNGLYYHNSSLYKTHRIVRHIIQTIRGEVPAYERNGDVASNTTIVESFYVESNADKLTAIASWNENYAGAPKMKLKVISPSEVEYDNNYTGYEYQNCMSRINIPSPEQGQWLIELENDTYSNRSFSLGVDVKSDLRVIVSDLPFTIESRKILPFNVEIKNYLTPVPDANIVVKFEFSDSVTEVFYIDHDITNQGSYFCNLVPQNHGNAFITIDIDIPSLSVRRIKKFEIEVKKSFFSDPLVVTISKNYDHAYMSWNYKVGANSYWIYSSDDPYTEDWGDPIDVTTTNTYTEPLGDRMFYIVFASEEEPPSSLLSASSIIRENELRTRREISLAKRNRMKESNDYSNIVNLDNERGLPDRLNQRGGGYSNADRNTKEYSMLNRLSAKDNQSSRRESRSNDFSSRNRNVDYQLSQHSKQIYRNSSSKNVNKSVFQHQREYSSRNFSEASEIVGYIAYECIEGTNHIALPLDAEYETARDLGNEYIGLINTISRWNPAYQSWSSCVYSPGFWIGDVFDLYPGNSYFINVTEDMTFYSIGKLIDPIQYNLVEGSVGSQNDIMVPLNRPDLEKASDIGNDIGAVNAVNIWQPSYQSWNACFSDGESWMGDDFDIETGMPLRVNITEPILWPDEE